MAMNDTQHKPKRPAEDESDPNSLSVDAARERINTAIEPIREAESLGIRDALGRVLAEDVRSDIDVPGHTNSAMDGYAILAGDVPQSGTCELRIIGTSWAGKPFSGTVRSGQCVRIMTGAKLPEGADCVAMQEHAEREGDLLRIGPGHQPDQNVRHAGEDIARGDTVLARGKRIGPAEMGLLASLGIPEIHVVRRPRVTFFSTGDELRPVGEPLEEGQIYDSNRYTLYGMLSRLDVDLQDLGVVPDDREAIENAFQRAASDADAVITSGGVSVGEADFVKETLEHMGNVNFWKIAMKPGKPLAFGRIENACFFGLPGNPVSVMATFYQFVQPALRRLAGETKAEPITLQVPCASRLKKRPGRTDFQRGILGRDADGRLVVESTGMQGSHLLTSMSRANCFIVLPADSGDVEAGTLVDVQPFEGLT